MEPFDWDSLDDVKYRDEEESFRLAAERLVSYRTLSGAIEAEAAALTERLRGLGPGGGIVTSLLAQIDLASPEGMALMRICEAFGRSNSKSDKDTLIHEQLSSARWENFSVAGGVVGSGFAIAAKAARMVGKQKWLGNLGGNLAVRQGVEKAVSDMAGEFVLGETIEGALKRARKEDLMCSFDMLGEGARTLEDADRYEADYAKAIAALAVADRTALPEAVHGVSVKLSALDCRYEATKEARAFERLYPRLERLMLQSAAANIDLYIDAEESDRLVLSLKLLDRLEGAAPREWSGLGLAVQAYQRRAIDVVDRLIAFAQARQRRLKVRLVKGAYWDGEIKKAQLAGTESFPVFTSKAATDTSYLACAEVMLGTTAIYSAFATHNAHTMVAIRHLAAAAGAESLEFQRLHGMGADLYAAAGNRNVRVYAPVGRTDDLLPYLVRRLLENGANSSFVSKLRDPGIAPSEIVRDPLRAQHEGRQLQRIENPGKLFGDVRSNSAGFDLSVLGRRAEIASAVAALDACPIAAASIVHGKDLRTNALVDVTSPADRKHRVGTAALADDAAVEAAFAAARVAQPPWDRLGGRGRAEVLVRLADALEAAMPRFVALMAREAGKTLADGVGEVREAVDFCRFYAASAAAEFSAPITLPAPAGETNSYSLRGRGIFVCISPSNFPLAIFIGQIAAALAAGNAVVAKPADQTPLTAHEAVRLFIATGLNPGLISLLIGGRELGAKLVQDERHAGVAFTGSTLAAKKIHLAVAARPGAIPRFVAETGGLNAIFADQTALVEQLVDDVLTSAFGAAGQRCSSARFLFIPQDGAAAILHRLEHAMSQLVIGDPSRPDVDVGPLIDEGAKQRVLAHIGRMRTKGCRVIQAPLPDGPGIFVPPTIIEVSSLDGLDEEVFGPVLHVLAYPPGGADSLGHELRNKNYALTLGIHTRLDKFEADIIAACPAGNIYVNRSTIGAVVGVQPFGGFGKSGTGPKAGGPQSLHAYADEIVVSENLMAKGGDLALINRTA